MDWSPPGSPVHGILQARILEWVAVSFSSRGRWGPNDMESPETGARVEQEKAYISLSARGIIFNMKERAKIKLSTCELGPSAKSESEGVVMCQFK